MDPDEDEEKFDPEAYLRRELRLYEGSDGMTLGKLQLDPAGAVWVRTALAYFAAPGKTPPKECGPQPAGDQGELPIGDERTQGQRYADALVEICRLAMDADKSTTRREPPHVLVITTPEQLADAHTRAPATGPAAAAGPAAVGPPPLTSPGLGDAVRTGPLSRATLARLTCDAILQAVVLDTRTGAALNSAATNAPPHSHNEKHWLPEIGGASSPAVTLHPVAAMPTTPRRGPPAGTPTSVASSCSAKATTPKCIWAPGRS